MGINELYNLVSNEMSCDCVDIFSPLLSSAVNILNSLSQDDINNAIQTLQ